MILYERKVDVSLVLIEIGVSTAFSENVTEHLERNLYTIYEEFYSANLTDARQNPL